jgi:PadR family transcriptional regulator PadR
MKNYTINEADELLDELVLQWVEMYKKSVVTVVILRKLRHTPLWAKKLEQSLVLETGWDMTERGLYRTLQRLTSLGLITYSEVDVPKTGAPRKNYMLTPFGEAYLSRVEQQMVAKL